MAELLLVLHCSPPDAGTLVEAIRTVASAPIHRREEAVLGRDFSDAGTHEQVRGVLHRIAFELVVEDSMIPAIIAAVASSRRKQPVRWHSLPNIERGRIS